MLCVTGREVAEAEYAATFANGRWSLAAADLIESRRQANAMKAAAGLGDRSTRIIKLVSEHPDGIRAREVAQAEGISQSNAGEYLRRLADAGRLGSPQRGLYTPVESVESVESDEVDPSDSTLPTPRVESRDTLRPADSTLSTQFTATQGDCDVCHDPLDPVIVAEGFTTHPNCADDAVRDVA